MGALPVQGRPDLVTAQKVNSPRVRGKWDRDVSPTVVGATGMIGLVAFSIVACYAYYPSPREVLEEMTLARTETLTSANSGDVENALRWLEQWEQVVASS